MFADFKSFNKIERGTLTLNKTEGFNSNKPLIDQVNNVLITV